jgi:hypothetical protein
VSNHIEDESAILSCVLQAAVSRPADRQPAQDEWPRIEGKFLATLLALIANQLD